MKAAEVLTQLEKLADPQTKKTWARHGCPEPLFGVKIADMKTLIKKLKIHGDTNLAKDLYKTKNGDAMYLAGLIANGSDMTRADLDDWANRAQWHMISEYTVPWVATEHPDGWDIGLQWIESKKEKVAAAGWMTLAGVASTRPDDQLDLKQIEKLLDRCATTIHQSQNTVRSAMNCFVISVGSYVKPLTPKAKAAAKKIGEVEVDMGDTACKVPLATDYIEKVEAKGRIGVKRKSVKC
jgi:3-methyladenine DNA glycosylase AlkD